MFRDTRLDGEIEALVPKYPSIRDDVRFIENLLRDGTIPSRRCGDFYPAWVWRTEVHVSAFDGENAQDRCSLVYERDGAEWGSIVGFPLERG